jgi:hypothetical protein
MKFLRHLDPAGNGQYGSEQPDGSVLRLQGNPLRSLTAAGERARIPELLAPIGRLTREGVLEPEERAP